MMIETICPLYRRRSSAAQRNEPSNVRYAAAEIANSTACRSRR